MTTNKIITRAIERHIARVKEVNQDLGKCGIREDDTGNTKCSQNEDCTGEGSHCTDEKPMNIKRIFSEAQRTVVNQIMMEY